MKYLILVFFALGISFANANQLTLYMIPSPHGMDWTSPQSLGWSAIKNRLSFKPRFIGHVFVEISCDQRFELTGMVGKNFDYLKQILINGRGLGIFYHSFEGKLESQTDIEPELKTYLQSGRANFVSFDISKSHCQRILTYLDEYKENKIHRYYGLAHRPRFAEGAGCSAFGASFLDVLKFIDEDIKTNWSVSLNIPLKYAGPPLTDSWIFFPTIIFASSSWASPQEKFKPLTFWDPDRMHRWVKEKMKNLPANYSLIEKNGGKGVLINKENFPMDKSPIWLQHRDAENLNKSSP